MKLASVKQGMATGGCSGKPTLSQDKKRACLTLSRQSLLELLTDIAQLLDGWHTDVVWSDWDENIRKRVSEMLKELYAGEVRI